MAFSPDGQKLITGGQDGDHSVRIFDLASGKEQRRLLWHNRRLNFIGFAQGGKTLVTASDPSSQVYFTNLATGEVIRSLELGDNVHGLAVALSPDGKMLALAEVRIQSGNRDLFTRVRLVDTATGRELRTLSGVEQKQWLSRLIFTPDGKTLVSASAEGVRTGGKRDFTVWDLATGTVKRQFPEASGNLHFSPDGKHLYAVGTIIRTWDIESGKERHPPEGLLTSANSVAFSPDGKTLATCGFDDRESIVLWDSATARVRCNLPALEAYVRALQFAPDGRLISGGSDSTLRVWDVEAGKEVFQFKLYEPRAGEEPLDVMSVNLSPDGKILSASALGVEGPRGDSATVFAWDMVNKKLLARQELKGRWFFDFPTLTPDGRSFLLQEGKKLVVKEIFTRKVLHTIEAVSHPENAKLTGSDILEGPFAFAPNGKLFGARSSRQRHEGPRFWRDNYAIRLFDLMTGKEVYALPIEDWRQGLAFAPDSKRLAGICGQTLRIWDVATARELWRSPELDYRLSTLAFSPDGTRLASGLDNTTILIWDVGSNK